MTSSVRLVSRDKSAPSVMVAGASSRQRTSRRFKCLSFVSIQLCTAISPRMCHVSDCSGCPASMPTVYSAWFAISLWMVDLALPASPSSSSLPLGSLSLHSAPCPKCSRRTRCCLPANQAVKRSAWSALSSCASSCAHNCGEEFTSCSRRLEQQAIWISRVVKCKRISSTAAIGKSKKDTEDNIALSSMLGPGPLDKASIRVLFKAVKSKS